MKFRTILSLVFSIVIAGPYLHATPLETCLNACSARQADCLDVGAGLQANARCRKAGLDCKAACRNSNVQWGVPALSAVEPLWGWSGDVIRVSGSFLFQPNLTVTIAGQSTTTKSSNRASLRRSFDVLEVQVPALHSDVKGPVMFPLVITAGNQTFRRDYAYSPVIIGSKYREIANTGPFLASGYASAEVSLDRETGHYTGNTSATVYAGPFDSLPYSVVALFFDADGKLIGSTEVRSFSPKFDLIRAINGNPAQFQEQWAGELSPLLTVNRANINQTRNMVVHVSTSSKADLEAQVTNFIQFASTMAQVLAKLLAL